MFARFDEIPAMTLQDINKTKRYGRTHGQRENSIPTTNKVCRGIKITENVYLAYMNMFARFDEIPAMTLQDIKKTKRYGRTHGQCENSIPTTNKVCRV